MAEAENCRGECEGGLLDDITVGKDTQTGKTEREERVQIK